MISSKDSYANENRIWVVYHWEKDYLNYFSYKSFNFDI